LESKPEQAKLPDDSMFTLDSLWIYIAVPAIIIFTLLVIKLKQKKPIKTVNGSSANGKNERVRSSENEVPTESLLKPEETQARSESPDKTRPQDCPHYLGYLYMNKAPDRSHIPTECYSCVKLLQCLYSPNIIEKVYGE
jgi:hypothetical protein